MKTKEDYIGTFDEYTKRFGHSSNHFILTEYFMGCDFYQFTMEELELIGFGNVNGKLRLVPSIYYSCIPDGTYVKDIIGNFYYWDENMDNDVRMGFLAYGIDEEMLEEERLKRIVIQRDKTINGII
tara:strand:- start:31167 stop:31544 length:378 start_codon:yes stop_codon:yes gene_type:complete